MLSVVVDLGNSSKKYIKGDKRNKGDTLFRRHWPSRRGGERARVKKGVWKPPKKWKKLKSKERERERKMKWEDEEGLPRYVGRKLREKKEGKKGECNPYKDVE